MEEVKKNKKVLYHFAVFAIVNKLLIIKNHRISPAYWLMQVTRCGRLVIEVTGSCIINGNGYTYTQTHTHTHTHTHERCVMLDPILSYESFSPSFYHKIKFSNGIEKCFVYRCTCIHECQKNINSTAYKILQLLNLLFFF